MTVQCAFPITSRSCYREMHALGKLLITEAWSYRERHHVLRMVNFLLKLEVDSIAWQWPIIYLRTCSCLSSCLIDSSVPDNWGLELSGTSLHTQIGQFFTQTRSRLDSAIIHLRMCSYLSSCWIGSSVPDNSGLKLSGMSLHTQNGQFLTQTRIRLDSVITANNLFVDM